MGAGCTRLSTIRECPCVTASSSPELQAEKEQNARQGIVGNVTTAREHSKNKTMPVLEDFVKNTKKDRWQESESRTSSAFSGDSTPLVILTSMEEEDMRNTHSHTCCDDAGFSQIPSHRIPVFNRWRSPALNPLASSSSPKAPEAAASQPSSSSSSSRSLKSLKPLPSRPSSSSSLCGSAGQSGGDKPTQMPVTVPTSSHCTETEVEKGFASALEQKSQRTKDATVKLAIKPNCAHGASVSSVYTHATPEEDTKRTTSPPHPYGEKRGKAGALPVGKSIVTPSALWQRRYSKSARRTAAVPPHPWFLIVPSIPSQ